MKENIIGIVITFACMTILMTAIGLLIAFAKIIIEAMPEWLFGLISLAILLSVCMIIVKGLQRTNDLNE